MPKREKCWDLTLKKQKYESLIMDFHYQRCETELRPRIFGMSAPLIKGTNRISNIPRKVNQLMKSLHSDVYAPDPNDVKPFDYNPKVCIKTYPPYEIDPEKYEHIWPDFGVCEERWERFKIYCFFFLIF